MAEIIYTESYIKRAKINWAHIGIALLVKYGYVDRILTTNFDPMIIRACAMLGEYPAIYYTAVSQLFKSEFIPDKAVFYLHRQHNGFIFMNTEKECLEQSKRLRPVFEHNGSVRSWIVAGYSGENDPVFTHLTNFSRFDNHLYWIGYQDCPISNHVW